MVASFSFWKYILCKTWPKSEASGARHQQQLQACAAKKLLLGLPFRGLFIYFSSQSVVSLLPSFSLYFTPFITFLKILHSFFHMKVLFKKNLILIIITRFWKSNLIRKKVDGGFYFVHNALLNQNLQEVNTFQIVLKIFQLYSISWKCNIN